MFLYCTRDQELTLGFFTPLSEYTSCILRGEVQRVDNEGDCFRTRGIGESSAGRNAGQNPLCDEDDA